MVARASGCPRFFRNFPKNVKTLEPKGVFHLPKDFVKFRKLRWEMFLGEGGVPLIHSSHSFSGSLHHLMYFPPKYKMAVQLSLNEMLVFSLQEESLVNSDDDDVPYPGSGCNLHEARSSQK